MIGIFAGILFIIINSSEELAKADTFKITNDFDGELKYIDKDIDYNATGEGSNQYYAYISDNNNGLSLGRNS